MPIPSNLLIPFLKPDTAVPDGLTRASNFDDKYLLGCSSEDVSGGGTGGATTHVHSASAHANTFNATGTTLLSSDGFGFASLAAVAHGHTGTLGSVAATVQATSNDLSHYTAIFCKSNGTLSTLPEGCGFWRDDATFTGNVFWADGNNGTPDLRGKYLKGASAGNLAGGTGGQLTHKHAIPHTHPNGTSGGGSASINGAGVRGRGVANVAHTHVVGATDLDTLYSDEVSHEPPYNALEVWYSFGSPLETGMIFGWEESKASIPSNFEEVIGQREVFTKSKTIQNTGESGGSTTHGHTSRHEHDGVHVSNSVRETLPQFGTLCAKAAHTHYWKIDEADANISDCSSQAAYPEYRKVYFIKYTGSGLEGTFLLSKAKSEISFSTLKENKISRNIKINSRRNIKTLINNRIKLDIVKKSGFKKTKALKTILSED
jgi:hypothetical protein